MSVITRPSFPRSAVIAASGTESDALNLKDAGWGSLQAPASMTGSTITFLAAVEDEDGTVGTYGSVRDRNGNAVSYAFGANAVYPVPEAAMAFDWMKIVSSSAEDAARNFNLRLKG